MKLICSEPSGQCEREAPRQSIGLGEAWQRRDLCESRTNDWYFGAFEANRNEMLIRRVREIAGIEGSVSWFAEILA